MDNLLILMFYLALFLTPLALGAWLSERTPKRTRFKLFVGDL